MNAVLLDTGPLYALAITSDQYHEQAMLERQHIQLEALNICTLYPIVAEAYSLVLRRVSPNIAHTWLQDLLNQISLLNVREVDYLAAAQLMIRFQDQQLSLFDALLAVTANELNLPVWTFDSHFDVMRVSRWRR